MSADLMEWFGAQLDADEQVARDRRTNKPGNPAHRMGNLGGEGYVHVEVEGSPAITMTWEEYREEFTVPAEPDRRVLADIAAKRAIVNFLDPLGMPEGEGRYVADKVLRLLATAYTDRDGYREQWRP